MAGSEPTIQDISTVIDAAQKAKPAHKMSREECEIHVASTLAEGFRPREIVTNGKPVIGADKAGAPTIDGERTKIFVVGISEVTASSRKAEGAIAEAARNRGRETNAFKTTHDHLQLLLAADITESEKLQSLDQIIDALSKVKDWDKPQWFKKEPANWRDASGRRMTEHEFITSRNAITVEQMARWDEWAGENAKTFAKIEGTAKEQVASLDDYLVRRVAVDSLKNWLRRRPEEAFIHTLFQALAQNKLYVGDENLRVRCAKDAQGRARGVESRDGVLYFEGTDEIVELQEDEHGKFIDLPNDTDLIIFEKRMVRGKEIIIPIAQPNAKDPNIQWFGGNQVKRGWGKEQRFFEGPQCFTMQELYGFFPEHFPMRITNSVENGKPTPKTGAAIYGYARDHAGRQARQLIAEYGIVMDGLKRNNSQLINDMRITLGLQRPKADNVAVVGATVEIAQV
jgi:hypothetical protein